MSIPAYLLGRDAHGRRVYRVTVEVITTKPLGTVADWLDPITRSTTVIAHSAADAANWVRDQVATIPCTTVRAYGPKGARVERFIGYESAIFAEMMNRPVDRQMALFSPPEGEPLW